MKLTAEDLSLYMPFYLTAPQREGLSKAIDAFPACNYYCSEEHDGLLQGDGWTKLEILRFKDAQRRHLRGILISNSCDIDASNTRRQTPRILFAPLVPLAQYCDMLARQGASAESVGSMTAQIRKQGVTSLFYLPAGRGIGGEHVALLDNIHNLELSHYSAVEGKSKLFTLSQIGFYVFLMKLSIHFCRMHEGEVRGGHE